MKRKSFFAVLSTAALFSVAQPALSESKLPSNMVWTAYGTATSGYAQAVAIGNVLKNKYGTTVSVKPGKNDISRMTPLKKGAADYCMCGISAYFGSEGVGLFAGKKWGPQPVRLLLTSMGATGIGMATAKDANIKTLKDLKGKRIPWVAGADSLNIPIEGYLAFAGLSWDDVEKVEFSGFKGMWEALSNGQVDTAFAITVTSMAKKLDASSRGIHWLPAPHEDKDAWGRFTKVAPYFVPTVATVGAGISEEAKWEGAAYAYPLLIANKTHSDDEVYTLVKAMDEDYADYKDNAPGAKGWALDKQNFNWVMPIHEGAVRYFKDKGIWSEQAQAHNDSLIKRQDIMLQAFNEYKSKHASLDDEAFKAGWIKARAEALTKENYAPVFK